MKLSKSGFDHLLLYCFIYRICICLSNENCNLNYAVILPTNKRYHSKSEHVLDLRSLSPRRSTEVLGLYFIKVISPETAFRVCHWVIIRSIGFSGFFLHHGCLERSYMSLLRETEVLPKDRVVPLMLLPEDFPVKPTFLLLDYVNVQRMSRIYHKHWMVWASCGLLLS